MERTARQLRADDTRARLFAAAAELLLEHGYHATTVEKIAARAGVAKGTFFLHFPTKDAVVLELVRIQCKGALKARAKAIESGASPLVALREAAMELGRRAGVSRNVSRAVLAAALEDESVGAAVSASFDEVLQAMIADARSAAKQGLLSRADAERLAQQLMVSYLGSVLYFASTPHARPLAEVLETLVDDSIDHRTTRTSTTPKPSAIGAHRARQEKVHEARITHVAGHLEGNDRGRDRSGRRRRV